MAESLKVLIVDDESPARKDIRRMLAKLDGIQVVGEGRNGLEAVRLIRQHQPDLVLLDIQMPGLDGFQVIARVIESEIDFPSIIFITAYDQYALKAFEVHAVDYLLKPVDEDRLAESIERVKEKNHRPGIPPGLESFLRDLGVGAARLAVRQRGNLVLIDTDDILYATVSDGEVTIFTQDGEGIPRFRSLDELLQNLPGQTFLRVHRSYLVNFTKIDEIISDPNGSYRLRLGGRAGPVIPLSRTHVKKLRGILKW